ncbi:universal stress protein [Caenispirillum bisanense]|uniref:UspA domain-containing protein n=1 Tax=Caenispirillum bisanense TaxID=414052 RepID=A0A286G8R7_9PROT|nr:universal stress protein [Caenispirillum bisanense]SOD91967.1 hypothetical protein SAMN05421508_102198 [Caenispirillum bisanense]
MTGGAERAEDAWGAIVVALDASPLSLAGLRLAARLARHFGAPVSAVCVEDADIARLARHPGAVALCTLTGRARPLALTPEAIAGTLAGQRRAAQAAVDAVQRALADEDLGTAPEGEAAASFDLPLHRRQGAVAREIAAALAETAGGCDLLVLGAVGQARTRWQRSRGGPLGSTARALVGEVAPSAPRVLVLRRPLDERPPVFCAWDGSAGALRAFDTACALAAAADTGVAVLAFGDGPAEERRLGERARSRGVRLRVQSLPPPTPPRLVRAADFPQAVLVLPAELAMTVGLSTPDLIDRLSCSVLLVR